MPEGSGEKRTRSPINALKVLNQLREEKGLPRVSTKPKTIRITPELKKAVTHEELVRLFPEALTQAQYEFNDEQAKKLVREVELRLARIKAGKEQGPAVISAPRKPRGRPRKS